MLVNNTDLRPQKLPSGVQYSIQAFHITAAHNDTLNMVLSSTDGKVTFLRVQFYCVLLWGEYRLCLTDIIVDTVTDYYSRSSKSVGPNIVGIEMSSWKFILRVVGRKELPFLEFDLFYLVTLFYLAL